ncbi:MAG: TIGR04086 family membrane protein [Clostridia bacterium]|nr:TIGR04086 family membrane protein [Clostridia bacterium]
MLSFQGFEKGKSGNRGHFGNGAENSFLKTVVIGALSGFAATVGFIVLFAVVMLLANMDRIYASFFATLSVSAGAFVSAFYVAKRIKMKGVLSGLLTGLCYFIIITAVSLAADGSGFTSNTVFHLIIIILSAAIGGIVGANRKKSGIKL